MARFDAPPSETPESPQDKPDGKGEAAESTSAEQSALLAVLRHLQAAETAVANVEDGSQDAYDAIMDGKLPKMTASASGFTRGAGQGQKQRCQTCWHFAQFPARERKAVQVGACELTRPEDGPSVEPEDRCKFYSADGVSFPFQTPAE